MHRCANRTTATQWPSDHGGSTFILSTTFRLQLEVIKARLHLARSGSDGARPSPEEGRHQRWSRFGPPSHISSPHRPPWFIPFGVGHRALFAAKVALGELDGAAVVAELRGDEHDLGVGREDALGAARRDEEAQQHQVLLLGAVVEQHANGLDDRRARVWEGGGRGGKRRKKRVNARPVGCHAAAVLRATARDPPTMGSISSTGRSSMWGGRWEK